MGKPPLASQELETSSPGCNRQEGRLHRRIKPDVKVSIFIRSGGLKHRGWEHQVGFTDGYVTMK